jgi:hypothetical protein
MGLVWSAHFFSRSPTYLLNHHRALSRSTQSWASYSGYLREIRTQYPTQKLLFFVDHIINKLNCAPHTSGVTK